MIETGEAYFLGASLDDSDDLRFEFRADGAEVDDESELGDVGEGEEYEE